MRRSHIRCADRSSSAREVRGSSARTGSGRQPIRSTAAASASSLVAAPSRRTRAGPVAKFTSASATPSCRPRMRWTHAAHKPQARRADVRYSRWARYRSRGTAPPCVVYLRHWRARELTRGRGRHGGPSMMAGIRVPDRRATCVTPRPERVTDDSAGRGRMHARRMRSAASVAIGSRSGASASPSVAFGSAAMTHCHHQDACSRSHQTGREGSTGPCWLRTGRPAPSRWARSWPQYSRDTPAELTRLGARCNT